MSDEVSFNLSIHHRFTCFCWGSFEPLMQREKVWSRKSGWCRFWPIPRQPAWRECLLCVVIGVYRVWMWRNLNFQFPLNSITGAKLILEVLCKATFKTGECSSQCISMQQKCPKFAGDRWPVFRCQVAAYFQTLDLDVHEGTTGWHGMTVVPWWEVRRDPKVLLRRLRLMRAFQKHKDHGSISAHINAVNAY